MTETTIDKFYEIGVTTFLVGVLAALVLATSGCGHQAFIAGMGTGFRVGGPEYGVNYGEGFFATLVTRDAVSFKAELDSTQGFSYDPASNTYKGIKSIEYSVGPQANGYSAEFAGKNPEVAKAYYEALGKYYDARKDAGAVQKPLISDEKSKEASKSISEVIKDALAKAKSIVDGRSSEKGEAAVFSCDGDCDFADLTGNASIEYQLSIATKLLEYDGDQKTFESTGERYKTTLEHFISELVYYRGRGHVNTPLRVKYATVENGVITKLMYAYFPKDAPAREVDCPSCVFMNDEDAD